MKSQITNKKNGGIAKLLIPILNKIIGNQDTYFVLIMSNHLKIISVHGTPLYSIRVFFPKKKKLLMGAQKFLGAKNLWRGCSKLED